MQQTALHAFKPWEVSSRCPNKSRTNHIFICSLGTQFQSEKENQYLFLSHFCRMALSHLRSGMPSSEWHAQIKFKTSISPQLILNISHRILIFGGIRIKAEGEKKAHPVLTEEWMLFGEGEKYSCHSLAKFYHNPKIFNVLRVRFAPCRYLGSVEITDIRYTSRLYLSEIDKAY